MFFCRKCAIYLQNLKKMKLENKHFECIKEDNSEKENEMQCGNSKIVFDEFKIYLSNKNLKVNIIDKQLGWSSYFVMNYLKYTSNLFLSLLNQ